jgi:dolichol-phosphate mannosyltransferase
MLKIQKFSRIIKFGTVGISGIFVNSAILFFLTEIVRIDYRLSAISAIEISILNNFLWNSVWTWKDHKASGYASVLRRLFKFHLSCIFTAFFINYGLLVLLTELFKIPYMISNLIGIATGSTVNYLTSHFWVFQHNKPLFKNEKESAEDNYIKSRLLSPQNAESPAKKSDVD